MGNICPFDTESVWPKLALSHRSAVSMTRMTVNVLLQSDGLTHRMIDFVSLRCAKTSTNGQRLRTDRYSC